MKKISKLFIVLSLLMTLVVPVSAANNITQDTENTVSTIEEGVDTAADLLVTYYATRLKLKIEVKETKYHLKSVFWDTVDSL